MAITNKPVTKLVVKRGKSTSGLLRKVPRHIFGKLPKAINSSGSASETPAGNSKQIKAAKPKLTRKKMPSTPQAQEFQALTPAQEVQPEILDQISLSENAMEDFIVSANPMENGDLYLAVTACSIPLSDEINKTISTQLGGEPEEGEGKGSNPIFFKIGSDYDFKRVPSWTHALYGMGKIIISKGIEFSGQKIIFKNVSIYKSVTNSCTCPECSSDEDGWNEIGKTVDLELSLGQTAIEHIQAVCAHWDKSFCFSKYGQPKIKNDVRPKFLGFKMLGCKSNRWGWNWSDSSAIAFKDVSAVRKCWCVTYA